MTMPPLTGVLPVLQTPFDRSGSVDHGALRDQAEWCLGQGANGLVVGMVSEVMRLDEDERAAVTGTLAAVAAPTEKAVVASVGAESVRAAAERSRAAADAGATALMATPPMVLEADEVGLHRYYTGLAAATDLPLVVQDASGYVGRPMAIAFQLSLLGELGERVLFKPEAHPLGQRLSLLRDGSDGRARILEGSGGIALVDSYHRGVVGTMPAADLCWAVIALWRALQQKNAETADLIHGPLAALVSMQNSLDSYVAMEKHLLVWQGILPCADMREPVSYRLDAETAQEAERLATRLAQICRQPIPA